MSGAQRLEERIYLIYETIRFKDKLDDYVRGVGSFVDCFSCYSISDLYIMNSAQKFIVARVNGFNRQEMVNDWSGCSFVYSVIEFQRLDTLYEMSYDVDLNSFNLGGGIVVYQKTTPQFHAKLDSLMERLALQEQVDELGGSQTVRDGVRL